MRLTQTPAGCQRVVVKGMALAKNGGFTRVKTRNGHGVYQSNYDTGLFIYHWDPSGSWMLGTDIESSKSFAYSESKQDDFFGVNPERPTSWFEHVTGKTGQASSMTVRCSAGQTHIVVLHVCARGVATAASLCLPKSFERYTKSCTDCGMALLFIYRLFESCGHGCQHRVHSD